MGRPQAFRQGCPPVESLEAQQCSGCVAAVCKNVVIRRTEAPLANSLCIQVVYAQPHLTLFCRCVQLHDVLIAWKTVVSARAHL
eukprot:9335647-Lingulodinium_polyedra.AAC.1